MLTISRQGPSLSDAAAFVRDVPVRMIPYATATALTRTAKHAAEVELKAEMRRVFNNPTSYTLNALRIEPATREKLSARVMVKNEASGIAPENFLFPQVEGGGRKAKRSEKSMRYSGVLNANEFALPGKGMTLDANGNVSGAGVRTILKALQGMTAASNGRDRSTGRTMRKGRKLANDLFVGKPRGGNRPDGVYRREGQSIRPFFIFTQSAPKYTQRLDFSGVVAEVARKRFEPEFQRAVAEMIAKGGWK